MGLFSPLPGQERRQLEQEREQLVREIQATNQELAATQKNRANALNTYLLTKKQVENRQALIDLYQEELAQIDSNLARTQMIVAELTEDLEVIQAEYEQVMQAALRSKLQQRQLVFLLSAKNWNDAYHRLQYLRQYEQYRGRQSQLIRSTRESLERKVANLTVIKTEQEALLEDLLLQADQLSSELKNKNRLLSNLQSAERRLAGKLEQKEKAARQLDRAIEAIIQAEIVAAGRREEEGVVPAASGGNFVQARGRLPWPVRGGTIVRHFGINRHPTYKNVKTNNNGVDIRTTRPESVNAVFAGQVAGVQFIPGFKNTIIIKHGSYYTVYSNLETVYVKNGDNITDRQEIGQLSKSEPDLHFEVWRGKERLNPAQWIK